MAATPCCESLAVVAYQTLHTLREHSLSGSLRTAQPKRLRNGLFQLPAKLTTHARKDYLQFLRREPVRSRLLTALRGLNCAIPPTVPARNVLPAISRGLPTGGSRTRVSRRMKHPYFGTISVLRKAVPVPSNPPPVPSTRPKTTGIRPPCRIRVKK